MFAILVTFRIADDAVERFLELIRANAASSLVDEPGCHRFDILTDPEAPDTVVLYELYDDAAAFDHHRQTQHFKLFDAEVAPIVKDKSVRRLSLVRPD